MAQSTAGQKLGPPYSYRHVSVRKALIRFLERGKSISYLDLATVHAQVDDDEHAVIPLSRCYLY